MRNPSEFYRVTKESAPWPRLMYAASLAPRGAAFPRALDLGCGAGRDTRYLLAEGFDVTAVDENAEALDYVRKLPAGLPAERLHLVRSSFEDFPFAASGPFDLISAQFSLPFTRPEAFGPMFAQLTAAIRPGGIFTGHFFGVNDQWNREGRPHTFVTRQQAEDLLRALEALELVEEDSDGQLANGTPKHWHVFHILARRPGAVTTDGESGRSGD
jgi:SAM-dependent methyltransferase